MASILLGQYIQKDSKIHQLTPKIKLVSTILFITAMFITTNIYIYSILMVIVIAISLLAKIKLKTLFKGLKSLRIFIFFMLFFNILLYNGTNELFSFWIFTVYKEGLITAGLLIYRLVIVISYSSLLTLTTKPIEITDAIEEFLTPLKRFKVPASEIGMMVSISLRFIPTLFEETDKIMKAQASRGIDFVNGKLKEKIKGISALIIPLFLNSLRRADELANAMEVRGYNGSSTRTKLRMYKKGAFDYMYLSIHILIIVSALAVTIFY